MSRTDVKSLSFRRRHRSGPPTSLRSAEVTSAFSPSARGVDAGRDALATSSYACRSSRAPDPVCASSAGETVPRAPSEARVARRPYRTRAACRAVIVARAVTLSATRPPGRSPVSTYRHSAMMHAPRQRDNPNAPRPARRRSQSAGDTTASAHCSVDTAPTPTRFRRRPGGPRAAHWAPRPGPRRSSHCDTGPTPGR